MSINKLQKQINPNIAYLFPQAIHNLYLMSNAADMNPVLETLGGDTISSKIAHLFNDIGSSVYDLKIYPFTIPHSVSKEKVIMCEYEVQKNGQNYKLYRPYETVDESVAFTITVPAATSFLDFEPFKQYNLYIPFIGGVALESKKILGKTLTVSYYTDLYTGEANVYVDNGDETLYQGTATLGIPVPMAYDTNSITRAAMTLGVLKSIIMLSATGFAANPTSTTTTSYTEKYTGRHNVTKRLNPDAKRIRKVYDLEHSPYSLEKTTTSKTEYDGGNEVPSKVNSILGGINIQQGSVQTANVGNFGAFTTPLVPYLEIINPNIENINNFGYYYGYACAEEITIGDNHWGYCELSAIERGNYPDITPDELDMIYSQLKSGVYITDEPVPQT